MVVFAKLISQPLQKLYSTRGRGHCVEDYPRLLSGVGKAYTSALQRVYSTPDRGRFVKNYLQLLSGFAVLVFPKFVLQLYKNCILPLQEVAV